MGHADGLGEVGLHHTLRTPHTLEELIGIRIAMKAVERKHRIEAFVREEAMFVNESLLKQ